MNDPKNKLKTSHYYQSNKIISSASCTQWIPALRNATCRTFKDTFRTSRGRPASKVRGNWPNWIASNSLSSKKLRLLGQRSFQPVCKPFKASEITKPPSPLSSPDTDSWSSSRSWRFDTWTSVHANFNSRTRRWKCSSRTLPKPKRSANCFSEKRGNWAKGLWKPLLRRPKNVGIRLRRL